MKILLFVGFLAKFCTALKITPRIVGGDNSTILLYPYQVQLEYQGSLRCGGSIVTQYHVLTAAHCEVAKLSDLQVRAGTSFAGAGGSLHEVLSFFKHEKYKSDLSGTPINDIAIIKIKEPFSFDRTRHLIDLYPNGLSIPARTKAIVTGYGDLGNKTLPSLLQEVTLDIYDKNACYWDYILIGGIAKGQICTYTPGKNICFGDSGGPLVIDNRLAGIVSWLWGDCNTSWPSAYTEVAYFRDWIDKHLI